MRFLLIVEYLLLPIGPVLGYRLAMHHSERRRWQVMAWSAAGGVVVALLFMAFMIFNEMAALPTTSAMLRGALEFMSEYAVFGLVLGLVGLLTRNDTTRRLLVYSALIVGLVALIPVVINAVNPPVDQGASGVVFGPDNVPARGVPVYLDRGSGPLERITTDSTGLFRAPLKPSEYRQGLLLICVPGGLPMLARPVEHVLTPQRYQIAAMPADLYLGKGLRVGGWRKPRVPRECLVSSRQRR